jgi:phytoene desaturase
LIGDSLEKIYKAFEAEEEGSAAHLKKFIEKAADNYKIAINELVYRPGVSPLELVTPDTIKKLGYFFSNVKKEVTRSFKIPNWHKSFSFLSYFWELNPKTHLPFTTL